MLAPDARRSRRSYDRPAAAAHIVALAAFAVAQPLLDLLGRQAEFFVAHHARPLDLVLIALLPSVVLPASLLLPVGLAAWLSRRLGRWAHLSLVAGLSGLIALQLLKRLAPGAPGKLLIAAAATLGLASVAGYRRWGVVRTFLNFVSPAAVLPPLLFLFASPVRHVLLPEVVEQAGQSRPGGEPKEQGRPGGEPKEQGGGQKEPHAAPVVMVVLDELPLSSLLDASDEIDPLRYPHLAALAGDGTWFRDATTVSGSTDLAVPIILSGRVPERPRLPLAVHYPDNLFAWLAGAGYRLHVIETQTSICPPELCSQEVTRPGFGERFDAMTTDLVVVYLHLLVPAGLADRLPAINATWHHFTERTIGTRLKQLLGVAQESAERRGGIPGQFDAFLEPIARGDRPALHFIHLMLPHVPWQYLPSGKKYGPVRVLPHGMVGETWGTDRWQVAQGFQRHLLQVGYVDSLIGRLTAKLKQQDLYDAALIVVVADHGANFRPGASRRGATAEHFADVFNVPLIVKLPAQRQAMVSARNVETIDVLPTLADGLDLALPWPVDGQSAIDPSLSERRQKFTLGVFRGGRYRRQPWDVEALRADRRQSVARKLRLFGSGARPGGLFGIGRRADLLGRPVSELVVAGGAPAALPATEIQLDHAWRYQRVNPERPFIPARVTGRASFARRRDDPVELAVAVNGTVEALTRTFGHTGHRARFTAMVREQALLAGHNLVEVFEISERPAAALVPTRQRGAEFALVRAAGEETIRASGLRIPVVRDLLRGEARLRRDPAGRALHGWAAGAGEQAAETLLVFINGQLAAVADNGLAPDSSDAQAMEPWRREASFRIQLPPPLRAGSEKIRLFAILDDAASEIASWPPGRRQTRGRAASPK